MEFNFKIENKDDANKAIDTIKKFYCCNGCKNYIRHYGKKDNGTFFQLYCGHCVKKSRKRINPDDNVCDQYEMKEENKDVR